MEFDEDLRHELNLLVKFPETSLEGLKIHHTADADIIESARRLFEKGLITQKDGGYLTDLGRETAEAVKLAYGLLTPRY